LAKPKSAFGQHFSSVFRGGRSVKAIPSTAAAFKKMEKRRNRKKEKYRRKEKEKRKRKRLIH